MRDGEALIINNRDANIDLFSTYFSNMIMFTPIAKILEEIFVLFSDEENTKKSARIFKLLEEFENPRGFPSPKITRGFFQ